SPGRNWGSPPLTARRAKIFCGHGNGAREPALLVHEADPPAASSSIARGALPRQSPAPDLIGPGLTLVQASASTLSRAPVYRRFALVFTLSFGFTFTFGL